MCSVKQNDSVSFSYSNIAKTDNFLNTQQPLKIRWKDKIKKCDEFIVKKVFSPIKKHSMYRDDRDTIYLIEDSDGKYWNLPFQNMIDECDKSYCKRKHAVTEALENYMLEKYNIQGMCQTCYIPSDLRGLKSGVFFVDREYNDLWYCSYNESLIDIVQKLDMEENYANHILHQNMFRLDISGIYEILNKGTLLKIPHKIIQFQGDKKQFR